MLDRYNREGDTYVTVNQQPHDAADAARLHGEIRAKAEAEATRAIIQRTGAKNEVVIARIDTEASVASCERMARVLFSINGVPYDLTTKADDFGGRRRVAEAIGELIAAKVARAVMGLPANEEAP